MAVDTHGGETILLVEDQPEVSEVVTNMLRSFGYRVLASLSPAEALKIASDRSVHIDLLITDDYMPEMRGTELAERFRAIRREAHVLFMTGSLESDVLTKFPEAGLLEKPFDAQELKLKVREILDNRRAA